MGGADAELRALIARLRSIGAGAPAAIAAEAAPGVEAAAKATAAAGTDPEGRTWSPRKDGAPALAKAASAITATARGAIIELVLTGAYVYHHLGKGAPERRILPDGGAGIPENIAAPIRDAARRVLERALRGGS